MTPSAAYQHLVRDEIEHVPLDEAGRSRARHERGAVSARHPDADARRGDRAGERSVPGYLEALADWDARFPGFGHDTHGVENRDGVYYVQCLKKGAR